MPAGFTCGARFPRSSGPVAVHSDASLAVHHDPPFLRSPAVTPAVPAAHMPKPELLETFPNPYADRNYEIFMETDEFTSLCPLGGIETDAAELKLLEGGAPDFATIRMTYTPAERCLELKSLKLYLWSFRNDGIFYERVVNRILDDLVAACTPKSITVVGDFNVRGGLKSIITATWTRPA